MFGAVFVYSGATGTEIRHHLGNNSEIMFSGVAGLGDVNGDGRSDYAYATQVPSGTPFSFFQQVRLISGGSGLRLYRLRPVNTDNFYREAMAGGVDVDGDGRPDLVIGAHEDGPGTHGGLVELRLGNDLYFNIDPDAAAAGDLATLTVREGVPGNTTVDAIVAVNGT